LATLLADAYANREALEEKIAEGRRNRKEAGNKYGMLDNVILIFVFYIDTLMTKQDSSFLSRVSTILRADRYLFWHLTLGFILARSTPVDELG